MSALQYGTQSGLATFRLEQGDRPWMRTTMDFGWVLRLDDDRRPSRLPLRLSLGLLSLPYGAATWTRNFLFDQGRLQRFRAKVPVLSVGNLTVGGTGKTPMVEFFARQLRRRGLRPAILSRGYGVGDGPNDEALLLEVNLPDVPHLQSPDRCALARIAVEELESQILILDDGFQHRRLHRDLDVVLLDATDPFGGGRLLPAGRLRESVRSLRRADLLVLTRSETVAIDQREAIRACAFRHAGVQKPWTEIRFGPTALLHHDGRSEPIESVQGKKVLGFAGIGNPAAFWKTIESLGGVLLDRRAFADHHPYSKDDVRRLTDWTRTTKPDLVLTTQKDQVKLPLAELAGVPLRAIRIEASVDRFAAILDQAVDALFV